ncbi:MAG: type II toxin-antitoxin system HicB family antitoxin [Verrucomicrobiota bacterium]
MAATKQYPVTLIESEEGFAVFCETLPGCYSQGASRAEALVNIREAIQEYLAAAAVDVPAVFGTRISHATIELPLTPANA